MHIAHSLPPAVTYRVSPPRNRKRLVQCINAVAYAVPSMPRPFVYYRGAYFFSRHCALDRESSRAPLCPRKSPPDALEDYVIAKALLFSLPRDMASELWKCLARVNLR